MSTHLSDWDDLLRANRTARDEVAELKRLGLLERLGFERLQSHLDADHERWAAARAGGEPPPAESGLRPALQCRQCQRPGTAEQKFCATCGGPTGSGTDKLRYLDFARHVLTTQVARDMAVAMAERCTAVLDERIQAELAAVSGPAPAATTAESSTTRPPLPPRPQPAPVGVEFNAPAPAPRAPKPRRSLFDILLDPRVIRWLLGSGGGLLVVGLVIYLSSLGIFKNALVVAAAMGTGTLALVGSGMALVRFTRHLLPGRALALLGCLVMPLNLWFYHANGLVTLDGHLWLAATVCCVLYAAVAVALKDPMFVYVFFGGIAMTGMLALADLHRVAEISAPATLLISLGLLSLHAERAFADDDGPFSRKRFGLACFWSAQALVGLGLTLLLGFQIASFVPHYGYGIDQFAALPSNRYLALGLVLAGGYAFAYSAMVVRPKALYGQLAVLCLLWAEVLGIQICELTKHLPVLLTTLGLTSLAMNVLFWHLARREDGRGGVLARPLAPLGLGLMAIVLLVSLAQRVPFSMMTADTLTGTWGWAAALVLAAVVSRVSAMLHAKDRQPLSVAYLIVSAAATFLGLDSLLLMSGVQSWSIEACLLMTVPVLYLVAARFHKDGPARRTLPTVASVAAIGLTLSTLFFNFGQWVSPKAFGVSTLWIAAYALEATLFFAAAAFSRGGKFNVYFAAAMACGLIYQVGGYARVPVEANTIAIALMGVAGLVGHRLLPREIRQSSPTARALLLAGHAMVSVPMASVMLMSLSRLALRHMNFTMLWMPAALGAVAVMAALISNRGGRRWYFSLAISQMALALLAMAQYSTLSLPRKFEVFGVISGVALLAVGYVQWFRTQDNEDDRVALMLFAGALLAGLPPAAFAVINRFAYTVSLADELTLMTISVLMFLTGMITRLRTTQVIGGGLLACHLLTLIVFAGVQAQLALGAYVAIGGAVLFGTGVLLSMNRERLYRLKEIDVIRCTC